MGNYSKATIVLSVAALLVSLVLVHVAESRVLPKSGSAHGKPVIIACTDAYGAAAGDTCFSITKTFNLTTDFFNAFNPNLDCDKIFVGQWLCVDVDLEASVDETRIHDLSVMKSPTPLARHTMHAWD